ncbi:AAA family ATPase [Virgibacillus halodenitrificans]|uniref:ATP-binding protein n=1 Tax=Virgibacillus halodenitrificans TaxID=1482 RepID=UPI0024BF8CBD|nr:AAA family ATPase [Virgibacillus halodenitrificans]WHX24757.1 AAA family ATPase [Virgibacillus halodenitrificans]
MKFISATINGFGKWVDESFDFYNEGVNCLYGQNESGKSTLHLFILFMLFGMPPKQRNFYRPKTSGALGGRLTIEAKHTGRFTIERFDGVRNGSALCYTEDGSQYDEEWLTETLQGISYATYQSIFSFSANDLNDFRNMKEDDLGEVLLGIGLTGSTAIHSVEKMLDNKISELFKPYGKKPLINQELDQLALLHKEVRQSASEEKIYQNKNLESDKLSQDIRTMEEQAKQLYNERLEMERKQQALPVIKQYSELREKLGELPNSLPFPEDGLTRYEKLKSEILPLRSEFSFLVANEKTYENRISILQEQLPAEEKYNEAVQLLKLKDDYTSFVREKENWQSQLNKLQNRLKMEINQLNIGISMEDVERLHLPFHTEKNWNQIKISSGDLEKESIQLQQEQKELTNQRMYTMNQIGELEDQLLDPHHVSKIKERLRLSTENELIKRLSMQSAKKKIKWEEERKKKEKYASLGLLGSIIVALILGLVAMLADSSIFYVGTITFLIIGLLQRVLLHRYLDGMEKIIGTEEIQTTNIAIEDEERKEAENLLASYESTKKDIAALEETLKSIKLKLMKWNEKNKIHKDAYHVLEGKIKQQIDHYPFLLHVEIDYWPELYHNIKHIVTLNQEALETKENIEILEEKKEKIQLELNQFSATENREWTQKNIQEQLRELELFTTDYNSNLEKIKQYRQQIRENKDQQLAVKEKLHPYETEIRQLYEVAQVDTEDSYYFKARQVQEKLELEKKKTTLVRQLNNFFDDQEEKHNVDWQEEELASRAQQIKTEEIELQKNVEKKRQELANIRAEILQMETSETHSYKLHQFEMKKDRLNELAKEWAVLKTAKEMLSETKRNYRDTYLSKVIQQTIYYFGFLTDGRYKSVHPPGDGQAFYVVTHDDIHFDVSELSKGTVDQLYISLRFAVSEVMSNEFKLPIIMDDAFIHFDTERAERISEIIKNIASKHQVLLFTCKKNVVEFFENENIIRL